MILAMIRRMLRCFAKPPDADSDFICCGISAETCGYTHAPWCRRFDPVIEARHVAEQATHRAMPRFTASQMRRAHDWLLEHQNADELVYDTTTGLPVKAVYSTVHGLPRQHVAEYYFAGEL